MTCPQLCTLSLELVGNQFQQGREGWMVNAQDDSGETQVTELHCEPQPVCGPAALIDDGKIGLAQRVVPDQLLICVWQRKQTFPLGGGRAPLANVRLREASHLRVAETPNQTLTLLAIIS
jgi:hypothetical protein